MNSLSKYISVAILVMLIISGIAYSAWYGWDSGLIGKNPRAPTAEMMSDIISKQVLAESPSHKLPTCITAELSNPPAEKIGFNGISSALIPGQYSITLATKVNLYNQSARDLQIAAYDYLTKNGLFSAKETFVDTSAGQQPAKRYDLSWNGYLATNLQNSGSYTTVTCFNYGKRVLGSIDTITPSSERIMDLQSYDVSYKTKITDIPAWLSTPEAKKIFPKLKELLAEQPKKIKLLRGKHGWLTINMVEAQLKESLAQSEGNRKYSKDDKDENPPAPSFDDVKKMVAAYMEDSSWVSRYDTACFPLGLKKGGDDNVSSYYGMSIIDQQSFGDDTSFGANYYDSNDSSHAINIITPINVFFALAKSKLAQIEVLNNTSNSSARNGIKYEILPEAISKFSSTGRDLCLPIGKLKTELLAVNSTSRSSNTMTLLVRGKIEQVSDVAQKVAINLPAVQSIIDYGLLFKGTLAITKEEDGTKLWRVSSLAAQYPKLSYANLPSEIAPFMPQTAAAPNLRDSQIMDLELMNKTALLANMTYAQSKKNIVDTTSVDDKKNDSAAGAGIYKWTDKTGKVHFSDTPPPSNIQSVVQEIGNKNKKDVFQLPSVESDIPHRFVLTSLIVDKNPVDNLTLVNINPQKKSFNIYVKLTGIKTDNSYTLRTRILDSKGQLVADKEATITSGKSTWIYFAQQVTPTIVMDAPGNWTFQGILDGKKLFVEERVINW